MVRKNPPYIPSVHSFPSLQAFILFYFYFFIFFFGSFHYQDFFFFENLFKQKKISNHNGTFVLVFFLRSKSGAVVPSSGCYGK